MKISHKPSPHHSTRRGNHIECIVLHDTGSRTLASAVSWCQDLRSEVSYHYIVDIDGGVVQLVDEDGRAWHAGKAEWNGRSDVNSVSIGVAMVNDGAQDYSEAQVSAAAELVLGICERYRLRVQDITRHRDVALPAGRKNDPHDGFAWPQFLLRLGSLILHGAEPPKTQRPTLRFGETSDDVRELQALLRQLPGAEDLPTTGNFRTQTLRIVLRLQHDAGLDETGVVDEATWAALERKLAELGKGGLQA